MAPITRLDPRYVRQRDPAAILHAWAGPDRTMPMGGWTDGDTSAFLAAVLDELRYGVGDQGEADATAVHIHAIARDEDGDIVCCHGE